MRVYGEHESLLCARCYIYEALPHMEVVMTKGEADFDGAVVGKSYMIESFSYDEFEPYEFGFKGFTFLRDIADKVICVGEREASGKRSKELKVILKNEYKALVDTCHAARHFNNATFTQAQLQRSKRLVNIVKEAL